MTGRRGRARLLARLALLAITVPHAPAPFADGAAVQPDGVVAYQGRIVPPMTAPRLPGGDWDGGQQGTDRPRTWDRALPFFAQRLLDKGIGLPNPYNIGVSLYFGREARTLSSLKVGFNGRPPLNADFVQFPNTRVENQSVQVQAGGWIFPFLNAYLIAGRTQGGGDIDIAVSGRDLMRFLGVPGCNNPVPALRPGLCSQTLKGTAHADYDGATAGAGMTFAGAHKNLFFALPVTYVVSDLSVSDTLSRTWNVAPRLGWNQRLDHGGMLTWYGGGTYLKSRMNITGSFTFPTAGTVIGADTSMSYDIQVQQKRRWNYLAGVNWTVSKFWSVMAEAGFGNARKDLILSGFFHF